MNDVIALLGNPNSGKTTLFNLLTGTYQKVGNWTGVTTEKKQGLYRKNKTVKIVDLPGIYSFSSEAEDEKVAMRYLKNTPPKAVINIVDGTNLERNLFLTLNLAELKIPTIIAVNMADDLERNGIKLNVDKLSKTLGMPVVKISALKNVGVDKLMELATSFKEKPNPIDVSKEKGKTIIEQRYAYIERIMPTVIQNKKTKAERFTQKADKILTHKLLGIPLFFIILTCVYFVSNKLGGALGQSIAHLFDTFCISTSDRLNNLGVHDWLISLICGAVIKGVGTVVSFLPQILVLFFLLALLENSGYMARVAFVTDRIFRSVGLCGKSVIPLIVSCGCTVTGLMATRTIEDKKTRETTIYISPFMPCGAKTAVFGWFSSVFFGGSALIASSMYFMGIVVAVVVGTLINKFSKGSDGTFILEMPTLRMPALKDVFFVLWEKFKDFTAKAGSVIFIFSILLWLLKSFGTVGYVDDNIKDSFLYHIGNGIKFFFYPLGFGNWQASVAVVSGFIAKEAVIETLALTSANTVSLFANRFSAYAFMTFVLLSPPCSAAIITAYRELKSVKKLVFMLTIQTLSAYVVALAINFLGFLLLSFGGLILSLFIVIILITLFSFAIRRYVKSGCKSCRKCVKGSERCPLNTKRNTTI